MPERNSHCRATLRFLRFSGRDANGPGERLAKKPGFRARSGSDHSGWRIRAGKRFVSRLLEIFFAQHRLMVRHMPSDDVRACPDGEWIAAGDTLATPGFFRKVAEE
jgi:hypothetical protein